MRGSSRSRVSSAVCRWTRGRPPLPAGWRPTGRGVAWSSTASTTGASRASATGGPPFPSSTATHAAWCRCPRPTCRWCCRSWRTSAPTTAGLRRWRGTPTGTSWTAPHAEPGHGARPMSPTRSSTRRGTTCAIPAPSSTTVPSTGSAPGAGARLRRTSAAMSTRYCTSCTRASSPWC